MYGFDNVTALTLVNCRETCIRCRRPANLISGVFDIEGDTIKMLSGPAISSTLLRLFQPVVEQAVKTGDMDKLQRDAEEISPHLGAAVKLLRSNYSAPVIVLFILILMLQSCSLNLSVSVDANKLIDDWLTEGHSK